MLRTPVILAFAVVLSSTALRAAGDLPGTMRPPVRAMAGTTYYRAPLANRMNAIGWGNYSSTCVDPSDPSVLWMCQEYAGSEQERDWCTAR